MKRAVAISSLVVLSVGAIGFSKWQQLYRDMDALREQVQTLSASSPLERTTPKTNVAQLSAFLAQQTPQPQPESKVPAKQEEKSSPAIPSAPRSVVQVRDFVDTTFHRESAASGWSVKAQSLAQERIRTVLPADSEVRSIDCRASLCRIETSHRNEEDYQAYIQGAFLNRDTQIWNGGVFSTRLDDASSAESRIVIVSYLAQEGQTIPLPQETQEPRTPL